MTFAEPKKQPPVSLPFTGVVARGQQGDDYCEKPADTTIRPRTLQQTGFVSQPVMMG